MEATTDFNCLFPLLKVLIPENLAVRRSLEWPPITLLTKKDIHFALFMYSIPSKKSFTCIPALLFRADSQRRTGSAVPARHAALSVWRECKFIEQKDANFGGPLDDAGTLYMCERAENDQYTRRIQFDYILI